MNPLQCVLFNDGGAENKEEHFLRGDAWTIWQLLLFLVKFVSSTTQSEATFTSVVTILTSVTM